MATVCYDNVSNYAQWDTNAKYLSCGTLSSTTYTTTTSNSNWVYYKLQDDKVEIDLNDKHYRVPKRLLKCSVKAILLYLLNSEEETNLNWFTTLQAINQKNHYTTTTMSTTAGANEHWNRLRLKSYIHSNN